MAKTQTSPAGELGLVTSLRRIPAGRARPRRFPVRQFSHELAVLLHAGIPLLEALRGLREKEASAHVCAVLDDMLDQLDAGQPFSFALRSRGDAFDPLFIAVVAASERTGQMERGLREHAAYLAWVERLRDRLVGASIYPLTLLVAGAAVLLFLILFVVPRFAGILEGTGGSLPLASRVLIEIGRVGGGHPGLVVGAVVIALVTLSIGWRQAGLAAVVRARLWTMPLLGQKLYLLALARFYRTASMLLGAGVPAVAALLTARAVIAIPLRSRLDAAVDAIRRGERLSTALDLQGLTTPVSLRMLRVGEKSGELGPMLGEAAAFYDEELARLTELVTRIVNPLLMLLMGVVIGTVVVLMYLPIFQLVEQVQ